MTPFQRITGILFRLSGITLVVLGVLFWTGHAHQLIPLHMALGLLFTILYLIIVAFAARRGLALGPVLLAGLWGFVVPAFGMIQTRLLVGPSHWIIRVTHLLIAVVAMGIADRLMKRSTHATPDAAADLPAAA